MRSKLMYLSLVLLAVNATGCCGRSAKPTTPPLEIPPAPVVAPLANCLTMPPPKPPQAVLALPVCPATGDCPDLTLEQEDALAGYTVALRSYARRAWYMCGVVAPIENGAQ